MCFQNKIYKILDLNKNKNLTVPSDFILDNGYAGPVCYSTLTYFPGGHWFFDKKCIFVVFVWLFVTTKLEMILK